MMTEGAYHDFLAGLISGSAGVLVGHPFDTVKVQLQVQEQGNGYKSAWDCVSTIRKQSWSEGFFRGLSWPLVSVGFTSAVFFGVYSQSLKFLGSSVEKQHNRPDYVKVGIASGLAGLVQPVVSCPIEVIKVVLQSQIPHGGQKGSKFYRGPLQGVIEIVKQNGLKGLYRGFTTHCSLNGFGSIVYLTSFEFMSHEGSRTKLVPQPIVNFFAGGLSGICFWFSILPLDFVKSRLQADTERKLYKNFLDCGIKSFKENGIKTFYRGAGVICVRAFVINAVVLMVYSEYMKFFDAKFLP